MSDVEMSRALSNVLDERSRQDEKWGEQNHNPYIYLAILVEEVGELAQAILQSQFGGKHGGRINVRTEAVHTAAVALALIECLDRDKWAPAVEFGYYGARGEPYYDPDLPEEFAEYLEYKRTHGRAKTANGDPTGGVDGLKCEHGYGLFQICPVEECVRHVPRVCRCIRLAPQRANEKFCSTCGGVLPAPSEA